MLLFVLIPGCTAPCPEGYIDQAGLCWLVDDALDAPTESTDDSEEDTLPDVPEGEFLVLPGWSFDAGSGVELYETLEGTFDAGELDATWTFTLLEGDEVLCQLVMDVEGEIDAEDESFGELGDGVTAVPSEADVDDDDCGYDLPDGMDVAFGFATTEASLAELDALGLDEEDMLELAASIEDDYGYTYEDLVAWHLWDQWEGLVPVGFVVTE